VLNLNVKQVRTTSLLIEKVTALTTRLFEQYKPQVLLIEKPASRRSRALLCMIATVTMLARRRRITVIELSRHEMQAILSPVGTRLTKAILCQAIAEHYAPRLNHYLRKTTRGVGDKEPYFYQPFMAVALGLAWFKKYRTQR
jgi:hypothetical protein